MLTLALVVVLHAEPAPAPTVEWPVWPAVVSVLAAIPAALGGALAFTQVKSCFGCSQDPVMFWTAAEGFGLGALLLLGGILFGAIAQHHNKGPSPDPEE